MVTPNSVAKTTNMVLKTPSAPKESFINIVDIMKPEFLITLLNLSVRKNEKSSNSTSIRIKIVKNSSKKQCVKQYVPEQSTQCV